MKRILALIFIILSVLAICPGRSYAADNGYPFTVEIIPPKNSIDYIGYYHVRGTPGEAITLQAKITNVEDHAISLKAVPMNAYSGPDGIFYQSPGEVNGQLYSLVSEAYGLAQYVSVAESFTLQPGQTETARIKINVPQIDKGTLLGSIRFMFFAGTQEMQNSSWQDKQGSILIDKYQAIDTAIQIDLAGQAETLVTAGTPSLTKDGAGLLVPLSNNSAIIEHDISMKYEIRDSRGATVFKGEEKSSKMAPMSLFNILIPLKDTLLGGDYTLHATIVNSGQTHEFTEPFTVGDALPVKDGKSKSRAPVSNKAEPDEENPLRPWLLAGFLIILLCFAALIYLTYKRNKQQQERLASGRRSAM